MQNNNTSGFTLLEVIIYVTIFAAVLTVAIFFSWDVIGSQTKSSVITEVNQNSRYILERIARDFRQAVTLNSVSESTVSFDTIDSNTVIYNFDAGTNSITRQLNVDPAIVLNNSAVQVSGTWTDLSTNQASTVSLDFSVQFTAGSGQADWETVLNTSTTYDLVLAP